MSALTYAIGLILAVITLALITATPFALAHSRTLRDHGPGCWWCHPRLGPRKRR
ncbi:hypothetical protein [Streptomyces daghestanicus]|uniref:Uncharacterized protein n=1 Tax=Streptomyces daghestanicus TaxID=66885 RepID=A0ABQ3Q7J5_9ACTN|nr:hypothetical protein [Streptomyces daghestanicus]GGU66468.1 hypothetical protein GCM10010259_65940 [Streptomyces daghestanicus]GHI33222.1 hypothetical protein Sdagh_49520 [Streptomyces daghestanicus]